MLKALSKIASLSVCALVGVVGLKIYNYQTAQQARVTELESKNTQLENVIERLGAERRMADIVVAEQSRGADGKLRSTLMMVEYAADGRALAPRSFNVVGERVHLDALVIKFEPELVKKADPLRGHALLLFEKIYGDAQPPVEGQPIDVPDAIPTGYRPTDASKISDTERALWRQFWQLNTDADLRANYGVKVTHGIGVFEPFAPGRRYSVTLQADGNITLYNEPLPAYLTAAMKRGEGR